MSESQWSLAMDRQGLKISGDGFTLTTNGSEPAQIDGIISELQAMTRRTYGQYCGLSRALEVVGERWGMLIIRDLLVGPRDVAQLQDGLRMIPAEVLQLRLKELEHSGVIRRQPHAEATGPETYELTEYGAAIEDVVLALGRWGAVTMNWQHPEEVVTTDAVVIGLRATFRPEAALGLRVGYELRIGEVILHARIDDGMIEALPGPLPGADLVIELGMSLKALISGDVSPADALADGRVRITGDPELLDQFVEVFRMPKMASPESTIWHH